MYKKLLIVCCATLFLSACERQQKGVETVLLKESVADFTTSAAEQKNSVQQPAPPMLPGKGQVLGAPFGDFQTRTVPITVLPSQIKTSTVPGQESYITPAGSAQDGNQDNSAGQTGQ